MPTLPTKLIRALAPFAPLSSGRVWQHAQVLPAGAILAPGQRTVGSAPRAMGLDQEEKRFHRYHRVLSRAGWSSREASRASFCGRSPKRTFVPEGPLLVLGIDETLERRRGKKIAAKGIYRDPVRSSHAHFVRPAVCGGYARRFWQRSRGQDGFGLCRSFRHWHTPSATLKGWVSRTRNRPTGRGSCSRWRGALAPTAKDRGRGGRHLFFSEASRPLPPVVQPHYLLITRLRLDAALYEPAPPRCYPGQIGRPRPEGGRLANLSVIAQAPSTARKIVTLADWYAKEEGRTVEVASSTAVWHSTGLPAVPLRWVLIRAIRKKSSTLKLWCAPTSQPTQNGSSPGSSGAGKRKPLSRRRVSISASRRKGSGRRGQYVVVPRRCWDCSRRLRSSSLTGKGRVPAPRLGGPLGTTNGSRPSRTRWRRCAKNCGPMRLFAGRCGRARR